MSLLLSLTWEWSSVFGPPVLHGTYSHTDTPASGDASEATEREHETGPLQLFRAEFVDSLLWLPLKT